MTSDRVPTSAAPVAAPPATEPAGEFVEFFPSGTRIVGDFRCADCAYGVFVGHELPRCPMCGQHVWERVAWRPFTRLSPQE